MQKVTVKIGRSNKSSRLVAVKQFEETLREVTSSTSKYYAYKFRDYLKSVIKLQKYKWAPLQKDYLDWKKKAGRDTRTLISSGEYVNSIQVFKFGTGYVVGLPNKKHKDSNLPLGELMKIIEFGTLRTPPRPHFRSALSVFIRQKGRV